MVDWVEIGLSTFSGTALGLLYFGGLWWTVARIQTSDSPVAIYLTSLLLRNAIALSGLFLILQVGVIPMLAALIGFIGARVVLVRRLGFRNRRNINSILESRTG